MTDTNPSKNLVQIDELECDDGDCENPVTKVYQWDDKGPVTFICDEHAEVFPPQFVEDIEEVASGD